MDISLLRKAPQDRIRTVPLFGSDAETADVLFCGREEMEQVRAKTKDFIEKGMSDNDASNAAWGRVALRGWKGLNDGDQPLDFTPENCDLLMLGSSEFRSAVLVAASSLRGGVEKNS